MHVRYAVERIAVLDEWGKRFQVTANVRIETVQDADGFTDESRVFEELRGPDGELLRFDGRRLFTGRTTGKRVTRALD
jgi:hypothetical protein